MKKIASKSILMMLALLLTLSSLSIPAFAVEKKDEKGEILNLPPFVDFEVKEKRKVDVIVDVGNTTKTEDQVNSWVNESLRPALQAEGLDYKIHVEKSNEGTSRQYYFGKATGNLNKHSALYYYDVLTGEHQLVLNKVFSTYQPTYTRYTSPIISPDESYMLYKMGRSETTRSTGTLYIVDITNNNNTLGKSVYPITQGGGWIAAGVSGATLHALSPNGKVLFEQRLGLLDDVTHMGVFNMKDLLVTLEPEYNKTSVIIDVPYRPSTGSESNTAQAFFNIDGSGYIFTTSLRYMEDLAGRYENTSIKQVSLGSIRVDSVTHFRNSGNVAYLEERDTGTTAYPKLTYRIVVYERSTNQKYYLTDYSSNSQIRLQALEDGRLIVSNNTDKKMYLVDNYKNYEATRTVIRDAYTDVLQSIGSKIFYSSNNSLTTGQLMMLDVDTLEETQVLDYMPGALVRYPEWYLAEKRTIQDIVNEGIYRADAEKYYVRIDDATISQLAKPSTLAETASTLMKNNITYYGLGNSTAKPQIDKLINTINENGIYFDNSNMSYAMQQVSSAITNRKEVDLHILMAKPGIDEASIKTTVKDLTTQLQKQNIMVTSNYVKGTDNSTLYELLNQVNWRDDRNNYVLFLHQGTMSEFNDPLVEEEISLLLKGNYAFFTAMGSATNQVANESLIASNNGNGYFFAGTNFSYMSTKLNEYMVQTAVKNPKRVSDTIVLNYDSVTGDYSSDVIINTYYEDFEKDRKINERFRTTHDPSVYENNTGVMEGIGQYQESPTTQFTKVGLYEMVVQVQDDPTGKANFSNYNLWSQDSLSRLVLYVHRAPVAEFSAIVNSSKMLTINDYSYDLDRYSQRNKGITTWVWKWKKVDDADWTVGKPPSQLQANTDYFVALKVKDIDGAWSSEVVKYVTTNPFNQPPVALFTIDPKSVSWSKQATITDRSYDPDGDTITIREWKVYRDNQLILSSGTTPTLDQIKTAAVSAGFNALSNYKLSLRVKDFEFWSETYSDFLEVINYPPIADFEPLEDTYRDSVNKVSNTTANPDQDGDNVTYQWKLSYGGKTYSVGTAQHPSFKVKDLGLGKLAVGTWQLELKASDPLSASSYMTHSFNVLNQIPTTTITSGRSTGYINEPYAYTSTRSDADTEDVASLQSFWRLTSPSGKVKEWYTQNISNTYVEKGSYLLENWVVDQLDAKSDVEKKNITILNQAPIPGFTAIPSSVYRGDIIKFVSTATDYDGYIDKHKYEFVKDDGTIFTLSATADFTKSFSTIGSLNIRQTVTDNDGATATIMKPITIVNRPPTVDLTTPTGTSPSTATTFTSLTPTIYWKMTDEDNDHQERYEVVLKSASGTVLHTSNIVVDTGQSFIIPSHWNLIENTIYRVSVRSFDGYDWSQYATDKYFNIITNQPPEAGFTWSPSAIWEGDSIQIKHQVKDSDEDMLLVQYKVTAPDGKITEYPNSNNSYSITKAKYSSDAFLINQALIGRYVIEQTVSDGKSDIVKLTQYITVNELEVIGEVAHTDQWEQYRLSYNQSIITSGGSIWQSNQFYAGEKFILKARTTNTVAMDSSSSLNGITYANSVTVSLLNKYDTTMLRQNVTHWTGELWHTEFSNMKKGMFDVIFEATYSNGIVKHHTVTIEIIGKASSFVSLHRWK